MQQWSELDQICIVIIVIVIFIIVIEWEKCARQMLCAIAVLVEECDHRRLECVEIKRDYWVCQLVVTSSLFLCYNQLAAASVLIFNDKPTTSLHCI